MKRLVLVLIVFFQVISVQAQSRDPDAESQDENAIRRIARERLYAGGADEESLKVQEQLPVIKKAGDNEAEAPHSGDAD